ncbi:MAG: hypothetical protein FWF59_11310 [Turicibacter sp.]|nr:hypothetical protein [Turicibacter sp.]
MFFENDYSDNISGLKAIEAQEVEQLREDAYIYFGRETCPYCREFADQFPEAGVPIHYVDTQNTMFDEKLQEIRDKYDVVTVPTFIRRSADGQFKKLDRDVRQTIKDFVAG